MGKQSGAMRAPRHDFAVSLDRDLAPREFEAFDEGGDVDRAVETVGRAVYVDLYHCAMIPPREWGREPGVVQQAEARLLRVT